MNTKSLVTSIALLLGALATTTVFAQAPAGSTGECKDGTYTSAKSKRGACAGHGGVKTWFAQTKTAPKSAKASTAATAPQAPARQAAAGSTGECKDGTYTSAKSKRGACAGHGGVKTWFEETKAAPKSGKAPAAATAPEATAKSTAAPAPRATPKSTAAPGEAAPGGGTGKVWVNTSSKIYHCSGDRWYGKTKSGEYMSEADATAKGYRPSRNKPCS